jgi:branched-chain amino acid transport system ATP-binding protein
MSDTPILEVDGLSKRFGGIVAVDGASFAVEEGSVTGLIGPNGAGKTTTFNLISGHHRPDDGTIRFRGTDTQELMRPGSREHGIWTSASALVGGGAVAGLASTAGGAATTAVASVAGLGIGAATYLGQERLRSRYDSYKNARPYQLARSGLVRTFQITRELEGMTVLENMMLAPPGQSGEYMTNTLVRRDEVRSQERDTRDEAMAMLEFLEIEHLADEEAGGLSGGQRKLLELGRVLLTDPELVLLDEPVAGVNPTLTAKLLERLEALREEGYTFFIIEHDMDVIMNISDTIIVMNQGNVLMEGAPDEVQQDDRVIDAYLGG